MEIGFETKNKITIVHLRGRLDAETSPGAESQLLPHLSSGGNWLVDLKDLEFISSAGLRVFLMLAKRARECGTKLTLCSLRPGVRNVFEISGFCTIFSIEDSPAGI